MDISNIFVIMILSFYSVHIIKSLLSKNYRKNIQDTNVELEKLRQIPVKTLEEQKRFIDLKYPKKTKKDKKFVWKNFSKGLTVFMVHIILYIIVFRLFFSIFINLNIVFQLWQAILFVILFPLLINYILEKFNIQKGDLSVYFK